jgi:hypothetical protein
LDFGELCAGRAPKKVEVNLLTGLSEVRTVAEMLDDDSVPDFVFPDNINRGIEPRQLLTGGGVNAFFVR